MSCLQRDARLNMISCEHHWYLGLLSDNGFIYIVCLHIQIQSHGQPVI